MENLPNPSDIRARLAPDLGDMPPHVLRFYTEQLVDWMVRHLTTLEQQPVLAQQAPGWLRDQLPTQAPQRGEDLLEAFADLERLVVPHLTHWNHPSNHAYFNSSTSGPGILAELATAALNINGMLWYSGPAASELEEVTLGWLRQLLGLPAQYWGIIYDTASVSTLHALAAAREVAYPTIRQQGSMAQGLKAPRVYCSEHAHSSVDKAVLMLGLGLDSLRKVPVDSHFRLLPHALEQMIAEDIAAGHQPVAVVATIGTTSCTSVDPVPAIADICRRQSVWLHVDAAHGGAMALAPDFRNLFAGWELADSIVVNPHKWMFVPMDLSVLYTPRRDVLRQAFSLVPEYLKTSMEDSVTNYMDYGIQLGRRFRSLKLWFALRYFGAEGMARRIREHVRLGRLFGEWVDQHPDFDRLAPVPMSTVCFRAAPAWAPADRLNELNEALMQQVNATGQLFISHTKLNGVYTLRMVVSHLHTQEKHVQKAFVVLTEQLKLLHNRWTA